ncbi:type 1 glutamine amidotransferase domain-containing protein [Hyphococcus lacteus]|uniref:Type 1 glutamine amidotransferase domain-containing protein n=1 Tax=Hyphococcus lacteus TaxID=3143536 RepID=A0ABV3Z316_9PROT
MSKLENKKIAIIATDGFEQSELFSPLEALKKAGAKVDIISLKPGEIQGVEHGEKGKSAKVDQEIEHADIGEFSGILIPGGLYNPDALRQNERVLSFVRGAFERKLPVASICHGPQVLISAGVVTGRKMTGYPSIQKDLENAGATVSDEEVVVDQGLVTSRSPDDLEAFNKKIVEEFCEGKHDRQAKSIAA